MLAREASGRGAGQCTPARTAVLQQADGLVKVDVLPAGEDRGRATAVAGPLERLHPPALDPLFLGLRIYDVRSTHLDLYNAASDQKFRLDHGLTKSINASR